MNKKENAKLILKRADKSKEIYHHDLRTAQLALGRAYVNNFVKEHNIKIVIKF